MTFDDLRQFALALPGVEEGPCFGTPAFYVRKKFLARLRADSATLVIKVGEDRAMWIDLFPDRYYITDHYRGYDAMLVRLDQADAEELRDLFEKAWWRAAPKRLVAQWDAVRSAVSEAIP